MWVQDVVHPGHVAKSLHGQHRWNYMQPFTVHSQSQFMGSLCVTSWPNSHVFGPQEKTGKFEENSHMHRDSTQKGNKPGTFFLWGDGANYYTISLKQWTMNKVLVRNTDRLAFFRLLFAITAWDAMKHVIPVIAIAQTHFKSKIRKKEC